ncbi:hypothetical protein SORBI_3002G165401 [Sorghum bicolor]|uniref:Uncharacterized protein n=1 Tax=Sorghum bicolor TaxID=4558 RepID=A0A1W0W4C3_SORBI|nr:hypothetical protein SORBI_3002G165401 [Sorghum bicolor]
MNQRMAVQIACVQGAISSAQVKKMCSCVMHFTPGGPPARDRHLQLVAPVAYSHPTPTTPVAVPFRFTGPCERGERHAAGAAAAAAAATRARAATRRRPGPPPRPRPRRRRDGSRLHRRCRRRPTTARRRWPLTAPGNAPPVAPPKPPPIPEAQPEKRRGRPCQVRTTAPPQGKTPSEAPSSSPSPSSSDELASSASSSELSSSVGGAILLGSGRVLGPDVRLDDLLPAGPEAEHDDLQAAQQAGQRGQRRQRHGQRRPHLRQQRRGHRRRPREPPYPGL